MTKDATICEIHHRVKNNLQTASTLLRPQTRRSDQQGVKDALSEAECHVQTIAAAHAVLSWNVDETVDFDEVTHFVVRMSDAVASTDHSVEVVTVNGFGTIPIDQTQALATALNELIMNLIEHGLVDRDGHIRVGVTREGDSIVITATDDGLGFEPGTLMTGLGTQIVHQMVRGELNGSVEWSRRDRGGTLVTVEI